MSTPRRGGTWVPVNWYLTDVGVFFGTIWFRKTSRLSGEMRRRRLFLRFGAVDYFADVWLNGEFLGSHRHSSSANGAGGW
jgi:beta-mannosidase